MAPSSSNPNGDRQQQQPSHSAFANSELYPDRNIWNSSFSTTTIDRPTQSRGTGPPVLRVALERLTKRSGSDENGSGSRALNTTSDADVWGRRPWSNENPSRPLSTSPQETRDGGVSNGSGFFDNSIRARNGNGFANAGLQGQTNGYSSTFSSQKRSPSDTTYRDSIPAFATSRDASLPPSRQSQGSLAFPDIYQGHTPSNSIHSQRTGPHHTSSLSVQSMNQRAFNMNRSIDDDLSLQFSRATFENSANGSTSAFNTASQPFQLNPSSQSWNGEGDPARLSGGLDLGNDIPNHMSGIRGLSNDRITPAAYRLEGSANPRNYVAVSDPWASQPSARDPRTAEIERRGSLQSYSPVLTPSYFGGQLPSGSFLPQFPGGFVDPSFNAASLRTSMIGGYGVPHMPASYSLNSVPPARPSREDMSRPLRSQALDDFRMTGKSKRFEFKNIYNHVVEFSGDQHGSRFIQQKLETANSEEKDRVFQEIEPNAIQLMKDVFGNYVVQKFFEYGNQIQKKILASKMRGKFVDLSTQVYACRVVQKVRFVFTQRIETRRLIESQALEHVLVEQQEEMCLELQHDAMKVIKDQNGNHVVQKIIELVPREHIEFIMEAVRGQVSPLAQHTYGCRVIQRMLEHGTEEDKLQIMNELFPVAPMLIMDQYGNYVAQHVIMNGKPKDSNRMIELVMEQLISFSRHKFASNVVERCIQCGTQDQRTWIRQQLTAGSSDSNGMLLQLMRDQYGNYVIRKCFLALDRERCWLTLVQRNCF